MKYWPTCRCAECLKIHFSFGEKASDFKARPILGELLYVTKCILDFQSSWYIATVNDKSFEGEKFRGLLGSSGTVCGESFAIFSITNFIHS